MLRVLEHGDIAGIEMHADVLTADKIRDIATSTAGRVRLTLLLSAADDPTLARDVRQAIEKLEGVTEVRVDVRDAAVPEATPARSHG